MYMMKDFFTSWNMWRDRRSPKIHRIYEIEFQHLNISLQDALGLN